MFNFLKKNTDDKDEEQKSIVSISFTVDEYDKINVVCDWSDDNILYAKTLAKLLFSINNGLYATQILNMLKEDMNNNPENKHFLTQTILEWNEINNITIEQNAAQNQQPIIKASEFSKNVQQ